MNSTDITFSTQTEECEYWRNLAQKYFEEKQEIQRELDDYVEDSRQLEKELEASLAQSEKKCKELQIIRGRTQSEVDSLRVKLEQSQREVSRLQTDVETLRDEKVQLSRYIRELEQKNDDLERAERVVAESVAAVEASLNLAIERNAILESEVDEKESLKVKLQRLVDETRDLKQELMVKERAPDNERPSINGIMSAQALPVLDSNRLTVEMETQTSPACKQRDLASCSMADKQPPPARLVALNLVNEILRKIGKFEAKIAAHRASERNGVSLASPIDRTNRRYSRPGAVALQSPASRLSLGN